MTVKSVEVSFAEYLKANQGDLAGGVRKLLKDKGIKFENGRLASPLSTIEDYERNVLIITQELKS